MKISSMASVVQQQTQLANSNQSPVQKLHSSERSQGAPLPEKDNTQPNQLLSTTHTSAVNKTEAGSSEQDMPTSIKGNNTILILDDSEKSQRMFDVYNRLSSEEQKNIIDTSLISDDDFLQLAEQLDDDQLADFMSVAQALQKAPALNAITGTFISSQTLNTFTAQLLELDPSDREAVLEQGKIHAAKVPPTEEGATYNRQALQSSNHFTAANDIRNFVLAVNSSADVSKMMEDIQAFDPAQQSDLLAIMADGTYTDRVLESLNDIPEALQGEALSYFANTLQKIDSFSPIMTDNLEDVSAILDIDNNARQTRYEMLDSALNLIENYDFKEEQLEDVFSDLLSLDITHQRAYLKITETGLELLTGASQSADKIDLSNNEPVMQALEEVRDSHLARDLVSKSRMGESRTSDDGTTFYEIKAKSTAEQDQQSSVELLVANAYEKINVANSTGSKYQNTTTNLAANLLQLDATDRDQLSREVSAELTAKPPLDQIDQQQLTEQLGGASELMSALAATEDIESLLLARQQSEQQFEQQDSDTFWRAADAAGENIDKFADLVLKSDTQVQQQILSMLSDNHSALAANDKAAAQKINALFSLFETTEDSQAIENFFTAEGY
jgi:hypothetical protein